MLQFSRRPRAFTLGYFALISAYVILSCSILPRVFPTDFLAMERYFGGGFVVLSTLICYLVMTREWSQVDAELARLQDDAVHDPLTRLINRRAFIENLDAAIHRSKRNATRMGLAFIDLDGFKQVNDVYGHTAGDQLLKDVALRLTECIRKGDLIARMGGDEFVVLIEPDKHEGSEMLAKRLLTAFRAPFDVCGRQLDVTLSIGVAFYPEHAAAGELLIRAADMAMYRVKKTGRNGYSIAEPADALAPVHPIPDPQHPET